MVRTDHYAARAASIVDAINERASIRRRQSSGDAVCNRLHSLEQQLCRWLLLSHDRAKADELIMTQELIAATLGVRREGVAVAAGRRQDSGAISYVRGHIKILDRQKLEETVCECYRVVKDEFDRLLG